MFPSFSFTSTQSPRVSTILTYVPSWSTVMRVAFLSGDVLRSADDAIIIAALLSVKSDFLLSDMQSDMIAKMTKMAEEKKPTLRNDTESRKRNIPNPISVSVNNVTNIHAQPSEPNKLATPAHILSTTGGSTSSILSVSA